MHCMVCISKTVCKYTPAATAVNNNHTLFLIIDFRNEWKSRKLLAEFFYRFFSMWYTFCWYTDKLQQYIGSRKVKVNEKEKDFFACRAFFFSQFRRWINYTLCTYCTYTCIKGIDLKEFSFFMLSKFQKLSSFFRLLCFKKANYLFF